MLIKMSSGVSVPEMLINPFVCVLRSAKISRKMAVRIVRTGPMGSPLPPWMMSYHGASGYDWESV